MKHSVVYPYSRPDEVVFGEPEWFVNDRPLEEMDLSTADYLTMLDVSFTVAVNGLELLNSLGKGHFQLELVLTAFADDTKQQVQLGRTPFVPVAEDLQVRGSVRMDQLGDVVTLRAELVLTEGIPAHDNRLAPTLPGTLIWTWSERIRVFGVASRFPMRACAFTLPDRYPTSLWHLHIESADIEASVMSAARLEVNSDIPGLLEILKDGEGAPFASRLLQHQLRLDVARQFIRVAAYSEELSAPGDHVRRLPPDSVGACACRFAEIVRKRAGLSDIAELRAFIREQNPSFEALLQSIYMPKRTA